MRIIRYTSPADEYRQSRQHHIKRMYVTNSPIIQGFLKLFFNSKALICRSNEYFNETSILTSDSRYNSDKYRDLTWLHI